MVHLIKRSSRAEGTYRAMAASKIPEKVDFNPGKEAQALAREFAREPSLCVVSFLHVYTVLN